jgi:hypothetical protein
MQNNFNQDNVLIYSPKNLTFTISKNYLFNKVAEVLVHLGLRLDFELIMVELIINLTKTIAWSTSCILQTRLD